MTALKDLPFDQYSRQRLVADFIDSLRSSSKTFTILDVGGYKGQTQRFSRQDVVTVLDVFDVKEKNYIKGDGTNLKIKDNSFDFVVSFDALEHIPKNKRKAFIRECSRVAKYGFFLCCPFENGTGQATNSEKSLNNIYKEIKNTEHQWLEEHIQNGLPTQTAIEEAIGEESSFCNVYSNKIENWISLQTLFFLSDALGVVSFDAGKLNRRYNENLYRFESQVDRDNAYRVIYFISSAPEYTQQVKTTMEGVKKGVPSDISLLAYLPEGLGEVVGRKIKEQHDYMQHKINVLSEDLATKEIIISNIQKSVSWRVTKPLRLLKRLRRSR